MAGVEVALLRGLWFSLCLSICLCQQDCTGVDCPLLDNCIDAVLDSGACCASCLQKGCTCEGYQYYDCVSAGFENGSVPEGDSYFVDYGSTECSCPLGGGRIICHFMSCPEVPPNCIEFSEPVDGCRQCQQLGCFQGDHKYEANHSFQVGPCWICHCPSEGGELMCYREPCDAQNTTDGNSSRHDAIPDRFDQHGQMHSFPRLDRLPFPGNLPLFKVPLLDKEDSDDYDYSPTDFSEEYPSLPVHPTQCLDVCLPVCYGSTGPGVSAKDLLQHCCNAGHRWANEQFHCKAMPKLSNDKNSVCCSCCALGLWMRRQGQGCDADLHLGYSCGHVFLTCCEEVEARRQLPLRGQENLRPTVLPRRVSERKFPKEAFSITTSDEVVNMVEGQEEEDECPLHHRQQCQHKCTSVWGSYHCSCFQGFILQQDGHSCSPAHNTPPSPQAPCISVSCLNLLTSYLSGNGLCSQRCSTVGGRVLCSCFPGFFLMKDGHTCKDVDECLTHKCLPHQRCVNTEGSFTCRPQITCPPGYHLKSSGCQDVDECAMRKDRCGKDFLCENTPGSFKCTPKQKCLSGFTQDAHGNCVDINECSSLAQPCSSSSCVNTVGSFSCQQKVLVCNRGYHTSPDGASCVDVDECQMGSHACGVGQICHNLPGSYRCDCQTGYQFDALRKVCTDVNECWSYPGRLCAQTCENTVGSYLCTCTAGFILASDQKNCEDINECDQKPCSQECVNMHGSYQCYCRQGYYLHEDGRTCEDIDECSQSIGKLCAFQCVNVVGSYLCACPPHGYVMSANGHTCTDVDECKVGSHNCSSEKTCFNLQGGFRCLSFDCPHNYKKVSSTYCERINCAPNSFDCQNSPLRITYYTLSFQSNILTPAQIFRMGPSPVYAGDHVIISITSGNEENYFSTRKLNSFTGAVYIQRKVREPKDFLIEVEMKLLRRGTVTSFLARLYVFFTPSSM
uniref:Fibulin 2 n=1 Tax=Oryzias latipes TaxID=8090 RepID=A0A3P9MPK3_ORYLA